MIKTAIQQLKLTSDIDKVPTGHIDFLKELHPFQKRTILAGHQDYCKGVIHAHLMKG